jgi:hypothetical protein
VNSWIDLTALWQIVVFGLLAGAGLPAIFAIGLRVLSMRGSGVQPATAATAPSDNVTESGHIYGGNPAGLAMGVFCFAVVLAAIGWGIYFIVSSS